MTTYHIFKCREGEFSYQANSKEEARDKALASYLIRRIRNYPHVPSDDFAHWRTDFLTMCDAAHYSVFCVSGRE